VLTTSRRGVIRLQELTGDIRSVSTRVDRPNRALERWCLSVSNSGEQFHLPVASSKLHIGRLILKIPCLASLFTLGAVKTGSYLVEDDGGPSRGALE